ncbi:MFS transporter [Agrococcus casei]|uniref:Permeases of the major facilitator superfamily n=1 Tax=Agrococcus casei LMG 22410 TaxID=1255656 RepID=A0A1R4GMG3_9MICO|nr:MFS transporter [Agrococcus casei]SJM69293.1 Permeases of the major facilitator superfamily [Agrococcus casei LMG 22410]
MATTDTHVPAFKNKRAMRAGLGAFVGTTIEWYDFYVYATAAALVFPRLFFPDTDPFLATMGAFFGSAVAFFVRPLGGIIFGHIGDRIGRRPALVITLVLMGVATVAVGLLPTYAAIGVAAPVLLMLLRAAQGLAVGGEWGGAALMSVESAPQKQRMFFGGFTQLGNPAGAVLSSGIFWLISMGGDDFLMDWGWRIPFLASIVLIGVGFWVRYRVEESPVFEQKVEGRDQSIPLVYALKNNWWPILLGIMILPIASGFYYLATTFVQNYAVEEAGIAVEHVLAAMTIASFVELLVTLPLAALSDKWGGKMMMYIGVFGSLMAMVPLLLVIGGGEVALMYIFVSLVRVMMSATWAPLATIMAQMFRPQSRYTSMSLAYGIGAAVWGGMTPMAALWLLEMTGTPWSVIALVAVMALINAVAMFLAPQHSDEAPVTASYEPRLDTTAGPTINGKEQ